MVENSKDNKKNDLELSPSYLRACPVCSKGNKKNKLKVVDSGEGKMYLHLTCLNCLSSILISASYSEMGITYVGVMSDLSFEDAIKFKDKEVFCADDVLYFYKELQKKNQLEKKLIYQSASRK
jgi:hypothetical protein